MPNGNSNDTETVTVSMPGWLIEEIDDAAKRFDQSRSDFIRRGVRKYLLLIKDSPEFWEQYRKNKRESLDKN